MILKLFLIFNIIFSLSLFGNSLDKLPNDVRWVVNSNEYKKLCMQTYDQALKDISSIFIDGHSVIVMDLDETVLDNSQYQIELTEIGGKFSMESWAKWVIRAEATLVPGAKDFFDYIRKMNIQIVFISNRMDARLSSTIKNMKSLGIYDESDIYLLRLDKKDKKHIRRNEIFTGIGRMTSYGPKKVVAYFGDAIGDFPNEIESNAKEYIFPNPMYGKW